MFSCPEFPHGPVPILVSAMDRLLSLILFPVLAAIPYPPFSIPLFSSFYPILSSVPYSIFPVASPLLPVPYPVASITDPV